MKLTWPAISDELREMEESEALNILHASYPALPREEDLRDEIVDAIAAEERGYYLPDEDERLREVYSRYLTVRSVLWEMVLGLKPRLSDRSDEVQRLRIFGLSFCAASILLRSASFIIGLASERPVVWKKLDEAEPRYRLERKNFTRLYRSVSSPRWRLSYAMALAFYEKNRAAIQQALEKSEMLEVVHWLNEEEPFFQRSRRAYLRQRLAYRLHSLLRRHTSGYKKVMFHLFQMGGSVVAEMKQPFRNKGGDKKVTEEVLNRVAHLLKAGDVIVTRHDDALSNLFLPGYWPHAALYIGSCEEREELGLVPQNESSGRIKVVEAKKDGVKYRELRETLAVDSFLILRPKISREDLKVALERAVSHEGKLYDFVFDFRNADRLVCTEVVYRAYHGVGRFTFELSQRSGRHCLSAEDLIRQGLASDLFELVLCYGVEDQEIRFAEEARSRILASLRKFGELDESSLR